MNTEKLLNDAAEKYAGKTGIELIVSERVRQREKENWTDTHDDSHDDESLFFAAQAYELNEPLLWQWDLEDFKPKDIVTNLIKAGALFHAEIDRYKRMDDDNFDFNQQKMELAEKCMTSCACKIDSLLAIKRNSAQFKSNEQGYSLEDAEIEALAEKEYPYLNGDGLSKIQTNTNRSAFIKGYKASLPKPTAQEVKPVDDGFLGVLTENMQAQIAGYYNDDKTDEERKIRNAVIEEYRDLISIYKHRKSTEQPTRNKK